MEQSLNLNENKFIPEITKNEPFQGGELELFKNPFTSSVQPELKTIGVSSDDLNQSLEQEYFKSSKDPFIQAQRFETPAIPGYETAMASDYFSNLGVRPGMDVEEVYGQAQTNWNKMSKAIFGSGALAWEQGKEQFLSWSDTFDLFKGDSPFKQSELEAINAWQDDFSNKYHIFQTQQDRNTFFNMSNFATTIQQSGYAIGAILEMAAEEFAMSALTAATFGGASELQAVRTFQLATKIGKTLNRTRELEKSLQSTNTLRKIFNNSIVKFVNPIGNLIEYGIDFKKLKRIDDLTFGSKALARTAARGFGSFYRDIRMINAGIAEAKSTVAPVMAEMFSSSVERYKEEHNGAEPSEELIQKFKEDSFKTVQTEGAVQAAWIALSDRVIFDSVFRTFKGLRFLDDKLITRGIFENSKKAIAAGGDLFVAETGVKAFIHQLKTSPFKMLTRGAVGYFKTNFMEGIQESGQDVLDEATKLWYNHKYGTEEERNAVRDMSDFLYQGAKAQLTMDGLKTFMSGFLTGGILNVLGGGVRLGTNIADRARDIDGYQKKVERADAERTKLVTSLNSTFKDKGNFYKALVNMNASMTEAAKNGNKKEYWDHRNEFINSFVLSAIKSGTDEVMISKMREAIDDLSTDEFKEAFKGTMFESLPEQEAKDKLKRFIGEFEGKVKESKKIYNDVRDSYGNPYNPSRYKVGTEEYNKEVASYMAAEEAFEHIAFSKATYLDIAKRQGDILNDLKSVFKDFSFNSLYSMTSPENTLKNELETLRKEYEATTDPKIKEEKKKKIGLFEEYEKKITDVVNKISEAEGNTQTINAIKEAFIKENFDLLKEVISLDNKNVTSLTTDNLSKVLNNIFDYVHLQTDYEDALSYFNLISNPYQFTGLQQAHYNNILNVFNNLRNRDGSPKDRKSIKLTLLDKNGKPSEVEIIEGDDYITEANPTKRVANASKVVFNTYEQDVITIESIDLDNKSIVISLNGQEDKITYTFEEFEKNVGKIWNLEKMDPMASIYFRNRDRAFKMKVSKTTGKPHRIDGEFAKKDYSNNSEEVNFKLSYEDDKDNPGTKILFANYKTSDGKTHKVVFNLDYYKKYGVKIPGKGYDLRLYPTQEEYLIRENNKRLADLYDRQLKIFEAFITEQESKTAVREKRRAEIDAELNQIETDIEEAEGIMQMAEEDIKALASGKMNSKAKKRLIETKQLFEKYKSRLVSLKETFTKLNAEYADVNKELEVLNETLNVYRQYKEELTSNNKPFLRTGKEGNLYSEQEEILQDKVKSLEERLGVNESDFTTLIESLENEQFKIEEDIERVEDTIKVVEKLISKFAKYSDIIDAVIGTDPNGKRSKKDLQTALTRIKIAENAKATPDAEKISLINNMLTGLNVKLKNLDENAVLREEVLDAINFINFFDILTKEKKALEDKRIEQENKIKIAQEVNEVFSIKENIEKLKKIQELLIQGQKNIDVKNFITRTKNSVKGATVEEAKEASEYGDIMTFEPVEAGENNEDDLFITDYDKPILFQGLYKTAGRHYENTNGEEERDNRATSPEADRFFTFTSNQQVNRSGENYFLVPITEANDKHGIVTKSYVDKAGNTVTVKDDIKLVVCKKVNGKYIPVNKFGELLEKEEDQVKDNLVYTSVINTEDIVHVSDEKALEWLKSPKNDSFVITKNIVDSTGKTVKVTLSDDEILREVKAFKAFRKSVIEKIKAGEEQKPFKVIGKSGGTQRREVLDIKTGRPQELPLQGRLIQNNQNFEEDLEHPDGEKIELSVVTAKSGLKKAVKPGRIVMQKGDTIYQVYNRRFTQEEIDNVFDILLTIIPMFGRKYISDERAKNLVELLENNVITEERFAQLTTKLTSEESEQFDAGITYLMHVLQWGQPKEGDKVGNKQFYIKKDSLFVGDKEYPFITQDGVFTLDAIIAAKDEIFSVVDKKGNVGAMFHSVNNNSVNKDKDNKKNPFRIPKVIDGKIVTKGQPKFKNYTEYLLSDKNDRSPIIYTNIKEYNKDEPQLANVYLKYTTGAKVEPEAPKTTPLQETKPKEPEAGATTTEEVIEETLENLPLDLSKLPLNEKIVIRRKFGKEKKTVDFYGVWDGKTFKIEKAYNVTDSKDVTETVLSKVPDAITNSLKQIIDLKDTTEPTLKDTYNTLLSDYISVSKVSETKKTIVKKDLSSIKGQLEKLVNLKVIPWIDNTTGLPC